MNLFRICALLFSLAWLAHGKSEDYSDQLVIGTQVLIKLKQSGHRSSNDLVEGLNDLVLKMLSEAMTRAEANGRKTIQSYDL